MFPNFLRFIETGQWSSKADSFTRQELKFPRFIQYITSGHCERRVRRSTMSSSPLLTGSHSPSHRPYVVILQPGETLYIPPYWFHFVQSVTSSVSLNVFSKSSEELRVQSTLFGTPLPFESDWPKRMNARAVYKFIEVTAKQLDINLSHLVRDLLESKYALGHSSSLPLGGGGGADVSMNQHISPHASDMKREERVEEEESSAEWLPWCREPSIDSIIGVNAKSSSGTSNSFSKSVAGMSREMRSLDSFFLGDMIFEEMVENIIATMFGTQSVPLFLCTCFTPVPLRDLLHGSEDGPPASLHTASCVRQWDDYNERKGM
jgi:hypothetical protein